MEHTKGKWGINGTIIQNETGYPIAQVWPNTKISSDDSIGQMKANARRIVQCVNSHDGLVKTCKRFKQRLDNGGIIRKETTGLYNCLRTAIIEAEKGVE